jgi:adenylate cyclase
VLLAGFIGSSLRLEYTVIGDTVNISSRICDLSKADTVYISQDTYNHVKDRVHCVPVGLKQLKGKKEEVMIYSALKPN